MIIGKKIINGFEDIVISETLQSGYEDITTVNNWIVYCDFLFKDYKFTRKQLQQMNWALLTNLEKVIVCQYRATTEQNCKDTLGDSFRYWMTDFDLKSQECRKQRFSLLKTVLIENVVLANRYSVLGLLNTTTIEKDYINFGIEGIASGDPLEGILDFVSASGSYLLTGVAAMSLTMIGSLTKEQMISQMVNVINTGEI